MVEVKNKGALSSAQQEISVGTTSDFVLGKAASSLLLNSDLPENKNIEQGIDSALESLQHSSETGRHIDKQGRRIASDLQHILQNSKQLIEHKNSHEQIQNFVRESNKFADELTSFLNEANELKKQGKAINKEELKALEQAQRLVTDLKDCIMFWIQSSDFRQLWNDVVQLAQNFGGRFQQKYTPKLAESAKEAIDKISAAATTSSQKIEMPLLDFSDQQQEIKSDIKEGRLIDDKQKQQVKQSLYQLLRNISENDKYSRTINNLFNIVNYLGSIYRNTHYQLQQNEHLYKMIENAKGVIASFCGEEDFDKFSDMFWNLINDIQSDTELNQYFKNFKSFVIDALEKPDEKLEQIEKSGVDELIDKWYTLWNKGQAKFSDQFNQLLDQANQLLDNVKNDEDTLQLQASFKKLARDMFTDRQGRPDLFITQQSLSQLKELFSPILKQRLENIPLPAIEGSNDTYDYILEEMTFNGIDILPHHFHLRMVNDIELDAEEPNKDEMDIKIDLLIDNIRMAFEGMRFYYKRKVIPKVEDSGYANVEIAGDGLELRVSWTAINKSNEPLQFQLTDVKCKIDELNITVLDSQHSWLDGIISTFFTGYIKRQVADVIVQKIRETLDPLHDQLNQFFEQQKQEYDQLFASPTQQQQDSYNDTEDWIQKEIIQGVPKVSYDTSTNEYQGSGADLERAALLPNEDTNVSVDREARILASKYHTEDYETLLDTKTGRGASGVIYSESLDYDPWNNAEKEAESWDSEWKFFY